MSDSNTQQIQQSKDAPILEPDDSPVEYPVGTIGWLEIEWRRREERNADFADLYAIPGVSLLQEVALLWWRKLSPRRLSNLVRELAFTIGGSDADWHLLPIDQAAGYLWARRENQQPGKRPTVDPGEFRKALEHIRGQVNGDGIQIAHSGTREETGKQGGPEQGEEGKLGNKPFKGIPKEEADILVRDWLEKNAKVAGRPAAAQGPLTTLDTIFDLGIDISRADFKIVLGNTPSVCPHADPPLPPEYLPLVIQALGRFPTLRPKEGQTIHWMGQRAWQRNLCGCFPGNIAETTGDPVRAGHGEGDKPDLFAALRKFASANLKGQERAVIEALCASNGKLPIKDLAVKDGVGWDQPFEGFGNVTKRLNPKLRKISWRLSRLDNAAKLNPLEG